MKAKSFQNYIQLREADEGKSASSSSDGLGAKVSLGDNNDLPPFEVSDDPKSEHYGTNKNLAPIVRAFKGGGNWGWSKDDKSGDDKPVKIGTKKLFLAGGAVRSHLKGEKANNIELATNASPDEVYHLLKQNGFEFVDDMGTIDNKKKPPHPNRKEGAKQFFWVMRSNKGGRPFTFGIKVNEDEFELDVFQRSARGFDNMDKDPEPGSHAEDAASRDFTANSMYIALTNDNGPNKELHDFHGGVHHMRSGRLEPIGGIESLGKHPSRLLRMARFVGAGDGDMKHMSAEDLESIRAMAHKVGGLNKKPGGREYMMKEFGKGMKKEGVNGRKYLKAFKDLGLLDSLFPGKLLDQDDMPTEIDKTGDNNMALAWMLRMNAPEMLEDLGLDEKDLKKVMFLIKTLGMNENMDGNTLEDLTTGFTSSGISGRKLRDWGVGVGGLDPTLMDAFLAHSKSPRVTLYTSGDDGKEKLNDLFQDLVDPFTGQKDFNGIKERKSHMELDHFRKHMEYMRPV